MDVSKAEKARLGIFIIGISTVLALILFFMVGKQLLTPTETYFTRLDESVSGLELGAAVKLNGVNIGSISAIRTDTNDITRTVVEFQIPRDVTMKSDMTLTIGTFGITGLKYLEVTGGNYASPDLPPGGEIEAQPSTLGRLLSRADTIAVKIDNLLGNMVALTSVANQEHLDRLISSSASLSEALEVLVDDLNRVQPGQRVERILVQVESISRGVQEELSKVALAETVEEYQTVAKELGSLARRADMTLLKIQEDLSSSMGSMKETMMNMSTFSRQIKENPSVLLRKEEKLERRQ